MPRCQASTGESTALPQPSPPPPPWEGLSPEHEEPPDCRPPSSWLCAWSGLQLEALALPLQLPPLRALKFEPESCSPGEEEHPLLLKWRCAIEPSEDPAPEDEP